MLLLTCVISILRALESVEFHLRLADANQLSIQSNDEFRRDDFEDPVDKVDYNGCDDHPVAVRSVR